jgi:hypothetical protein
MPMPVPSHQSTGVPEVDAGYYWEAANSSGLGTAGFTWIEGNGHKNVDGLQANTALQPIAILANGQTLFRFPNTAGAFITPAALLTAGWSGATGACGWYRLPDASGDITGSSTLFGHSKSSGNQRRLLVGLSATADRLQIQTSTDGGVTLLLTEFTNPFVGGALHFIEAYFDPLFVLGGSLATERVKLFVDLVQQTAVTTASVGTSLFDGLAGVTLGLTSSGKDRLDCGGIFYMNGIPSLANRVRLANRNNPTGVPLAA